MRAELRSKLWRGFIIVIDILFIIVCIKIVAFPGGVSNRTITIMGVLLILEGIKDILGNFNTKVEVEIEIKPTDKE